MKFTIFGIIIFLIGAFLLVSSSTITGFVIFDEIGENMRSIVGMVLIVIGIALIYAGREERDEYSGAGKYHRPTFRSRAGLRATNNEATWAVKKRYKEEHGRDPNREELVKYKRHLHETGNINSLIEEEHRNGRNS